MGKGSILVMTWENIHHIVCYALVRCNDQVQPYRKEYLWIPVVSCVRGACSNRDPTCSTVEMFRVFYSLIADIETDVTIKYSVLAPEKGDRQMSGFKSLHEKEGSIAASMARKHHIVFNIKPCMSGNCIMILSLSDVQHALYIRTDVHLALCYELQFILLKIPVTPHCKFQKSSVDFLHRMTASEIARETIVESALKIQSVT